MAASIFGERFYGRRTPAWHGLGVVMDQDCTVSEAMKYVDVDFEILTVPTMAQLPDGSIIDTNNKAIVREPTNDDPELKAFIDDLRLQGFIVSQDFTNSNNLDVKKVDGKWLLKN